MKKVLKITVVLALVLMTLLTALPTLALPYSTYTYSIDGNMLTSPTAYFPNMQIDSDYMGLDVPLNNPKDLVVGPDDRFYIADAGNNRVVVLDSFFKADLYVSSFYNEQGLADALNGPQGVFVTGEYDDEGEFYGTIYVADTGNNRIVLFDTNGEFLRILQEPQSEVFEKDAIYKPAAIAVDKAGGVYVVSATTYQGIIALNADGEFQGFIGAQKVSASAIDIFFRMFQTKEQRKRTTTLVSTEFNNITIDEEGFLYVTTSSIADGDQQAAIRSKNGAYSPVKKLNTSGDDIMRRNGFFGPGGEVSVNYSTVNSSVTGASTIVDAAVGPEGTWSIIDQKRSKTFTYDSDGNLLFAFGDKGTQLGNVQNLGAIVYHGTDLILLDTNVNNLTIYTRTEYGDILINALHNENEQKYDEAVDDWMNILQRNSNFDSAYIGIGKAYYREYKWTDAMEYFKYAYDTANYSNAYKMYRKDIVTKYIILVPIAIVVICFLIVKFFGYAAKVNARVALSGKKRTFGEELLYAFHLIFHPFDGFWDLKHEKRGSVRGGIFYLALAVLTFTYQAIGRGYIFNPRASYSSIFQQTISLVVPVFLWITANWCLTTLFDGEGSFKDIFVATGYALVPIPMFMIPVTICTHFLIQGEISIVNLLLTISFIWTGFLVFFGSMVTHDYSFGKNLIICISTIVGMAFIMFVPVLLSGLANNIVSFVTSIVIEISYRV